MRKNEQPYREWTNREHETMVRMRSEGFTCREIAEALGRSFNAVASRVQQRKSYRRVDDVSAPPRSYERVTIEKAEVPHWYERGWRFVGFDGTQCVFELRAA